MTLNCIVIFLLLAVLVPTSSLTGELNILCSRTSLVVSLIALTEKACRVAGGGGGGGGGGDGGAGGGSWKEGEGDVVWIVLANICCFQTNMAISGATSVSRSFCRSRGREDERGRD